MTANADTDTEGAGLAIKFGLTIDAVSGLTAEIRKARVQTRAMQPVFRSFPGSAVANAAGLAVIRFADGPDQGHMWFVHALIIGGLTVTTAVAGTADVFVSATDYRLQTPTAFGTQDWRDHAAALPFVRFYGHDLFVNAPDDLFVAVSGTTAAQEVVAVAVVEDIQVGVATPQYDI